MLMRFFSLLTKPSTSRNTKAAIDRSSRYRQSSHIPAARAPTKFRSTPARASWNIPTGRWPPHIPDDSEQPRALRFIVGGRRTLVYPFEKNCTHEFRQWLDIVVCLEHPSQF